jgi:glycosyltransferase involved in cell wall biosynthesis
VNVLHLIPTLELGGAERQLALIAPVIAKHVDAVHIGIRRGGPFADRLVNTERVHIHTLGDYKGLSPKLLYGIKKLARDVSADIVQTWLPQMDILGGLAARAIRIPWILSERSSKRQYPSFSIQNQLRRLLGNRADMIISNSKGGLDYWQDSRTSVASAIIDNALDIPNLEKATAQAQPPFSNSTQPHFLVVARMTPEKNHRTIISAADLLRKGKHGFKITFIGSGPEEQSIRRLINDLELNDFLEICPATADWWHMLPFAHGVISMSLHEGRPNVVREAMAARRLTILSKIPAHLEIANESESVFASPHNPIELAEVLETVIKDQLDTEMIQTNAYMRVSTLSPDLIATQYVDAYKHLLHK